MEVFRLVATVVAVVTSSALVACGSDAMSQPDRFSTLPGACIAVAEQTVESLVGSPVPGEQGLFVPESRDNCVWRFRPDRSPEPVSGTRTLNGAQLVVTFHLFAAATDTELSGADLAEVVFGDFRDGHDNTEDLASPLGDESYGRFSDRAGAVYFRRSNLTVEVRYEASAVDGSGDQVGLGEQRVREGALAVAKEIDDDLTAQQS